MPGVKAVTDGIVDAGVIPDDDGDHLAWTTLRASVLDPKKPTALVIVISAI